MLANSSQHVPAGGIFGTETFAVVVANATARRLAEGYCRLVAELFVEKFLPFHVAAILGMEIRKMAAEQTTQIVAAGEPQVLPEMIIPHAGAGDEGGKPFLFLSGPSTMVEKKLA